MTKSSSTPPTMNSQLGDLSLKYDNQLFIVNGKAVEEIVKDTIVDFLLWRYNNAENKTRKSRMLHDREVRLGIEVNQIDLMLESLQPKILVTF